MSSAYSQRNKAELEHLRKVVDRLTDEQIARPAGGDGWTVGALLGHIAFWDQRAIVLMERWKAGGVGTPARRCGCPQRCREAIPPCPASARRRQACPGNRAGHRQGDRFPGRDDARRALRRTGSPGWTEPRIAPTISSRSRRQSGRRYPARHPPLLPRHFH